ncbi:LysR family transcriptional regulator [Facklamia miroungae]|uniref:DNA-binding transcriptional regulator, LysR family n=1 Tax=Facklamia miroungae TaxID=120956 RepID=A0A1G7TAX2_9LACT|nr:LysR family transcriptional regulator [Facklamia miroungae]NKZ29718.1 LysR family transcriptional regulator [Facklamia miroungae]SDG31750.1 DNA-binding transcriptional regulator, LysR family [Facklamia miroungae]
MDIRQIKYFIAVAETKNISHAAKSLFVTQPTLSQAIKKIEIELDTQLFTYSEKEMTLTETGKILYERGRTIIESFDDLMLEIQGYNNNPSEIMKVGLTSLFAIQFMSQISQFVATHSNLELVLVQDGSRQLQHLLAEGAIDIGLLSFPKIEENIHIEPLNTTTQGYKVSVVLPKTNPLSTHSSLEFKDLKEQNFCTLSDHFMLGEMLPKRCRIVGFDPNIVLINNDWEVLLHSLKSLNSICILPSEFKPLSKLNDLAWVPLDDRNNYYPIGIALRNNITCTLAMNEFIALIKSN